MDQPRWKGTFPPRRRLPPQGMKQKMSSQTTLAARPRIRNVRAAGAGAKIFRGARAAPVIKQKVVGLSDAQRLRCCLDLAERGIKNKNWSCRDTQKGPGIRAKHPWTTAKGTGPGGGGGGHAGSEGGTRGLRQDGSLRETGNSGLGGGESPGVKARWKNTLSGSTPRAARSRMCGRFARNFYVMSHTHTSKPTDTTNFEGKFEK